MFHVLFQSKTPSHRLDEHSFDVKSFVCVILTWKCELNNFQLCIDSCSFRSSFCVCLSACFVCIFNFNCRTVHVHEPFDSRSAFNFCSSKHFIVNWKYEANWPPDRLSLLNTKFMRATNCAIKNNWIEFVALRLLCSQWQLKVSEKSGKPRTCRYFGDVCFVEYAYLSRNCIQNPNMHMHSLHQIEFNAQIPFNALTFLFVQYYS